MQECIEMSDAAIRQREHLFNQKLAREKEDLAREIRAAPPPKPRYSKRLIAMRHAEMLLAKTQRYEEAYDVRRTTRVEEANEYEALQKEFNRKQDQRRESL